MKKSLITEYSDVCLSHQINVGQYVEYLGGESWKSRNAKFLVCETFLQNNLELCVVMNPIHVMAYQKLWAVQKEGMKHVDIVLVGMGKEL